MKNRHPSLFSFFQISLLDHLREKLIFTQYIENLAIFSPRKLKTALLQLTFFTLPLRYNCLMGCLPMTVYGYNLFITRLSDVQCKILIKRNLNRNYVNTLRLTQSDRLAITAIMVIRYYTI